jgi:hypothetical protein
LVIEFLPFHSSGIFKCVKLSNVQNMFFLNTLIWEIFNFGGLFISKFTNFLTFCSWNCVPVPGLELISCGYKVVVWRNLNGRADLILLNVLCKEHMRKIYEFQDGMHFHSGSYFYCCCYYSHCYCYSCCYYYSNILMILDLWWYIIQRNFTKIHPAILELVMCTDGHHLSSRLLTSLGARTSSCTHRWL